MGTRADFYIGTGPEAEWLGSVGLDGYKWSESENSSLMQAVSEEEFRGAVQEISEGRKDFTSPSQGWPWPWNDSKTTDYAYAFVDGKTAVFQWGGGADWPDMSSRQSVTFGPRSGLMMFGG